MLEVVSESGVFSGFVHGSGANYYVARYVRCVVILPKKDGETIFQLVLRQALSGLSGEKCGATDEQQSAK
jgi:hypothetical protein